ncbi:hypothetical protein ACFXC8_00410 [Streptomyces sp. NPDC059441]|uniref:hypothetical protein n=1 Tax=Streptomyces sp. NPDC059441 TaxID=3346829 RepID=UPI00368C909F
MPDNLGPGFCWTCGKSFTTNAALDAHQLETGHEMDQEDHPLRQQPTACSHCHSKNGHHVQCPHF